MDAKQNYNIMLAVCRTLEDSAFDLGCQMGEVYATYKSNRYAYTQSYSYHMLYSRYRRLVRATRAVGNMANGSTYLNLKKSGIYGMFRAGFRTTVDLNG